MATKEFKLPDVGEGVAEGELVRWLVEPGETVSEDQPVAEVETDKAMVEVPSPYDGTVKELRAEEGETVPVGEVIITFDVADGEESGAPASASDAGGQSDADEGGSDGPRAFDPSTESAVTRRGGDGGAAEGGDGTTAAEASPASTDGRVFAPPSARRLARELGVDLSAVSGGGPGGRVTEGDVRAAAEDESEGEGEDASGPRELSTETDAAVSGGEETESESGVETATSAAGATEPAGRDRTLAAPATRRAAAEERVDIDDVPATETRDGQAFVTEEAVREYAAAGRATEADEPGEAADAEGVSTVEAGAASERSSAPPDRPEPGSVSEPEAASGTADEDEEPSPGDRVPYRGVRRTIGQQMERSKYTAPHVTHHDDADAAELVALREEYKGLAAERGVKLTYVPFVMKAVALALKEFPYVNSTLDEEGEEIILKDEYHVGVAADTDAGLMVPVVRDVDRKSVLQIARETNELVAKARDRSIDSSEMRGGSFTVTNVGGIGGEYATPIINYPETAILALGAIEKRPRVVDDEVVPRHTLPLSLSVDHRVVDGAVAARFTNQLVEYIENPKLLLLE